MIPAVAGMMVLRILGEATVIVALVMVALWLAWLWLGYDDEDKGGKEQRQ